MVDYVLVATAVIISVLLYLLVRWCLKELVLESVKIPGAAKFYLRILIVVLVLAAISSTIGQTVKQEGAFMEQVWQVASSLQEFMGVLIYILMVYVFMITILLAHLRRRNDQ